LLPAAQTMAYARLDRVLNDAKQTPFSEKRKMNLGQRIWMGRSRGQTGFANVVTAQKLIR
jgi:hypothetical protein